jgi:hypothetical protein
MDLDEEEGFAAPPAGTPATCIVCYSAPPAMLLLVCGHMVLCADCCAVLCEQEQPVCPVCRTTISSPAGAIDVPRLFDDPDLGQFMGFVPAEPRLDFLLDMCPLRESIQGGGEPPSAQEREEGKSRLLAVLTTLTVFADASDEQQLVALAGGAMDVVCAEMRAAPVCHLVQMIGSVALASLTAERATTRAEVREAIVRTRAGDLLLHALRCLAGGGAATAMALAPAMQGLSNVTFALPRYLRRPQAAALAQQTCRWRASRASDADGHGFFQTASLALLTRLASSRNENTRAACVPGCVAEAVRTLRSLADEGEHGSVGVGLALGLLHTVLVETKAHDAAARAAECGAALQAGALPALLAWLGRLSACACQECVDCCAWLLPTLQVLCGSSPETLRAALQAGIMNVLANAAEAADDIPQLASPLCALLAHCLPSAAASASADDDVWRTARAEAAAAAAAALLCERMVALTHTAAHEIHALVTGQMQHGPQNPQMVLRTALELGGHALAALASLLEHDDGDSAAAAAAVHGASVS